MLVKFTRSTAVDGQHHDAGSTADLPADLARIVCAIGKATPYTPEPAVTGPLTTDAAEGLVPEGRQFAKPKGKAK